MGKRATAGVVREQVPDEHQGRASTVDSLHQPSHRGSRTAGRSPGPDSLHHTGQAKSQGRGVECTDACDPRRDLEDFQADQSWEPIGEVIEEPEMIYADMAALQNRTLSLESALQEVVAHLRSS